MITKDNIWKTMSSENWDFFGIQMFLNAPIDVRISILGIHPMAMLHVSNLVNDGISLI